MERMSDDELVFFGSLGVHFAYHPGSVHQSNSNLTGEDQVVTTNSGLSLDEAVVVPDLPTDDLPLQTTADALGSMPEEFCSPLIKTALPSRLKGIVSGVRSALFKSNSSKWYRLKGCGNHTDGFIVQPISNSNAKLTIRGCAFSQTTARELLMTTYLSQLFSHHQIECANTSIGWFEYKLEDPNSVPLHSDVPTVTDRDLDRCSSITRCCILMETSGNKRLSDHLLYGIEQLFDLIVCSDQSHPVNQSDLLSLFPVERLEKSEQNEEELVPLSTWFASLTNVLQPIDYQRSNWLHFSAHLSDDMPADLDEDRWRIFWESQIESLNNYIRRHESLSNLLCSLYKRIGFECGAILGLMHYHRVSWGTYTDELGVHCNAHPNNFVIKLPTTTSSFFLAPLDFDMSFTERSYRPNQMNHQSFNELIQLELSGFELTLGGDSQASSGVTAWKEMSDSRWSSVRWLLRDVMLNEFQKIYDQTIQHGTVEPMEFVSNEQHEALYSLTRLALLKTMKETA